jgi:hypothetical protein
MLLLSREKIHVAPTADMLPGPPIANVLPSDDSDTEDP